MTLSRILGGKFSILAVNFLLASSAIAAEDNLILDCLPSMIGVWAAPHTQYLHVERNSNGLVLDMSLYTADQEQALQFALREQNDDMAIFENAGMTIEFDKEAFVAGVTYPDGHNMSCTWVDPSQNGNSDEEGSEDGYESAGSSGSHGPELIVYGVGIQGFQF